MSAETCETLRNAFNTIALLTHELVLTDDSITLLHYTTTLKYLYERWCKERRLLPPHTVVSSHFVQPASIQMRRAI